jgi:hypothetical protein
VIRSNKIRQAARGEQCTLQILGCCNGRTETVVFVHFPDESHGMGLKATDLSGAFACSGCHDAVDRRTRSQELEDSRDWCLRRAQTRTLARLVELEVVRIA